MLAGLCNSAKQACYDSACCRKLLQIGLVEALKDYPIGVSTQIFRPLVVVSSTAESVVTVVAAAAAAAVVASVAGVVLLPPGLLPLLAWPPEAMARTQMMMTAGLMMASGLTTWDKLLLYRGPVESGELEYSFMKETIQGSPVGSIPSPC